MSNQAFMQLSYWERKTWLTDVDFTIVGSGIVGLHCALKLREKHPKAKILLLERGTLPQGASTKNAGFACYGSASELLDDLGNHTEQEVFDLVAMRYDGLQRLRNRLGDDTIGYIGQGGYELFTMADSELLERCFSKLDYLNQLLEPIMGGESFRESKKPYNFKNLLPMAISNLLEGQLDTGRMMAALLQKSYEAKIQILNNVTVTGYTETQSHVEVNTDVFDFRAGRVFIATNGFAKQFGLEGVSPARAQVVLTKPIPNLKIKGTFHLDEGYYYFRDIDNRILLGGGRNLDFEAEETTKMGQTEIVQERLEELLRTIILPKTSFEIDQRWSGIMGVGSQKRPIIRPMSDRIFFGARLGGMGIAIGSKVGEELANCLDKK